METQKGRFEKQEDGTIVFVSDENGIWEVTTPNKPYSTNNFNCGIDPYQKEDDRPDLEIYLDGYKEKKEEILHEFIRLVRKQQVDYENDLVTYSGYEHLAEAQRTGVVSVSLFMDIYQLIRNPKINYTINHKHNED